MFCSKCGTINDDNAFRCVNCGEQLQAAGSGVPAQPAFNNVGNVPNYLVQAILITLCCCQPFGIVAIVYAAQVNGKLQAGDVGGAMECSGKAKMWCWLGFGLGLLGGLIFIGIQILGAIAAGAGGMQGY
ncbi:MAG: CD225/dispanin family protein [Sedimentisphaerales bacterium]|nr:CD225/dispanin family protein [Sedimentisphaerales bacterium]